MAVHPLCTVSPRKAAAVPCGRVHVCAHASVQSEEITKSEGWTERERAAAAVAVVGGGGG
ncbi:hypothetical protein EYF80_050459 [Liparis tanakae]|uniref:Uncharacterized protein n=1 Tax=Liparis tanakae TaxID=230148 RepID=A0A4Z2FEF1_9TELE|nr:hypothetical protein EYF80_050459 [Liparis tanakae]